MPTDIKNDFDLQQELTRSIQKFNDKKNEEERSSYSDLLEKLDREEAILLAQRASSQVSKNSSDKLPSNSAKNKQVRGSHDNF